LKLDLHRLCVLRLVALPGLERFLALASALVTGSAERRVLVRRQPVLDHSQLLRRLRLLRRLGLLHYFLLCHRGPSSFHPAIVRRRRVKIGAISGGGGSSATCDL